MKKLILIASLTGIACGVASAKSPSFEEQMAKWQKTGKTTDCINHSSIQGQQVIDDSHILFIMGRGKAWLNTLPVACNHLGFDEAFSHETWGGQICKRELIRPLDPMSTIPAPACQLGRFEEVEKVKDAPAGTK